jgi:hypothetical protein
MVFQALFFRIGQLTLWTAEQQCPIQGGGDMHLSRLRPFRLRWFLLVLSLFLHLAGGVQLEFLGLNVRCGCGDERVGVCVLLLLLQLERVL